MSGNQFGTCFGLVSMTACSVNNSTEHIDAVSTAIDTLSAQLTNKCMQLAEHVYVIFFHYLSCLLLINVVFFNNMLTFCHNMLPVKCTL